MIKHKLRTLGTLLIVAFPLTTIISCSETPEVETPEVETPDVETPEVEIPEVEIPEVEIETDPEKLIQSFDRVIFDFAGFLDGDQFAGGTAENYELVIGSGSFIPGFEDGMIGMQVGLEKDIEVTFPTDYHSDDLAGKDVIFKVLVKSIWRVGDFIQNGDLASFDYAGYLDGVPFEGGTAQGHVMIIGSGAFIPGFEEGMIGMATGEERDINVTFPTEYPSEELKGKAVVFKVKVNALIRQMA